ncbi:MAG: DUF2239 family protein [Sphingomonadales bacterium]|nr:DUF2239 family protein [Sphingomonadales bacterium]
MTSYTAFANDLWIATGSRAHIVETLRALDAMPRASDLLVFDDSTGAQVDFDLRDEPVPEDPPRGPGRPRLGVVPREVTLLPRHWDWLGKQRGGASSALRRLVEDAMRADGGQAAGRDAAYRFLSAIAGDRENFEEAIRALYADDRARFEALAGGWPVAVRAHAIGLAWPE